MQNEVIRLPNSDVMACAACDAKAVHMAFETQKFRYGTQEKAVELSARVPVWTCRACGDQFTDNVAEEARHAAVCKHLGRLTPSEISSLRSGFGLTQAQWADVTGFGIASIKRWESGNLIQNESADNLMRLLMNRDNLKALQEIRKSPELIKNQHPKFRTRLSAEIVIQASSFSLRRVPQLANHC